MNEEQRPLRRHRLAGREIAALQRVLRDLEPAFLEATLGPRALLEGRHELRQDEADELVASQLRDLDDDGLDGLADESSRGAGAADGDLESRGRRTTHAAAGGFDRAV